MHSLRARPVLGLVLAFTLFTVACASDSDDAADVSTEPADAVENDTAADPEPADDAGTEEPASSDPEADDDADAGATPDETAEPTEAAEPDVPADPATRTTNLIRALFNLDPGPDAIDCVLAEADERPNLAQAIDEQLLVFVQYSDDMLVDVTHGLNGCVDSLGLGGWATEAVGPSGDIRQTAPACFADAFDDPDQGDGLFHMFVALSFQFRYDPEFVPAITEVLADCTPVVALATLFATQAEAESGFELIVDQDCLLDALAPRDVSVEFWTALIDGLVSPITTLGPYLGECSSAPDADLLPVVPADFVPWSGTGALASVAPAARFGAYSAPPPLSIDPEASYEAVLATGGGEIRVRLFADTAPITVNNFVSLARDGYFDRTVFHRVLDDFMAQGGDPTGTGTGGPGYLFEDEVDDGPALDRPGLLAMANSGPNTNGSQFFITFVPTEWLTGLHTVFGEVIEGQEIVDAIERRDPQAPSGRGQVLESVTIIEN